MEVIFDGDLEDSSWPSVMMIAPKYCFDQYSFTPKACCSYSVCFAGLFQKNQSNSETLDWVGEAFITGLQYFFPLMDSEKASLHFIQLHLSVTDVGLILICN